MGQHGFYSLWCPFQNFSCKLYLILSNILNDFDDSRKWSARVLNSIQYYCRVLLTAFHGICPQSQEAL